jgi:hypothetical protein
MSVIPNEGESQFESYQAIITAILYAHYPPHTTVDTMSPYEFICHRAGITLRAGKKPKIGIISGPVIFNTVTHYKVMLTNGSVLDSYKSFQAKGTQGFCQMFAFFLAIDDLNGFIHVDQTHKIDRKNFKLLADNTFECLQKLLNLIDSDTEFRDRCELEFNLLDYDRYNIKPGTKFNRFLRELRWFVPDDVMYYIYDQPLVGWPQCKRTVELWDYFGLKTI